MVVAAALGYNPPQPPSPPEGSNVNRLRYTVIAAGLWLALPAHAALAPYQQQALDEILATMPPEVRAMARPQLETTLGALTEDQVQMFLEGYRAEQAHQAETVASDPQEPAPSAADDAYNRAQIDAACAAVEARVHALRRAAVAKHEELRRRYEAAAGRHGEYRLAGAEAWGRPLEFMHTPADLKALVVDTQYQVLAPEGRLRFDFSAVPEPDTEAVLARLEQNLTQVLAVWDRYEADWRRLAATRFDDRTAGGWSMKAEQEGDRIHQRASQALERIPTPQQVVDEEVQRVYQAVRVAVLYSRPLGE